MTMGTFSTMDFTNTTLESTTSQSSTEVGATVMTTLSETYNTSVVMTTTTENNITTVAGESTTSDFSSTESITTVCSDTCDGLSDGIVIAAVVGAFVLVICTISLIIYTQRRPSKLKYQLQQESQTKEYFKHTRSAMYDEIDPDIEIKIVSTGADVVEEKVNEPKMEATVENNPYVDCPANLYDKTFTPRPCVYELQRNIYHTVDTCKDQDDGGNIKAT
ncbi:uncharacterized protein LOC134271552 [Saccostrea cucullata]|uniref:uncharacterized protein LOC134271552 n=1 Tax=Saccostrea cuccullata TaxID=36930 RepID=UPI002ED154B0